MTLLGIARLVRDSGEVEPVMGELSRSCSGNRRPMTRNRQQKCVRYVCLCKTKTQVTLILKVAMHVYMERSKSECTY